MRWKGIFAVLRTLAVVILAAGGVPARAQERASHHLFLELGGSGLNYSLNYERLAGAGWALRLGASTADLGIMDYSVYFGGVSRILGAGPSGAELGLTTGLLVIRRFLFLEANPPATGLYGSAVVGYRRMPRGRGLTFRIAFTPLFTSIGSMPFAGLSLGYAF